MLSDRYLLSITFGFFTKVHWGSLRFFSKELSQRKTFAKNFIKTVKCMVYHWYTLIVTLISHLAVQKMRRSSRRFSVSIFGELLLFKSLLQIRQSLWQLLLQWLRPYPHYSESSSTSSIHSNGTFNWTSNTPILRQSPCPAISEWWNPLLSNWMAS